VITFCY